MDWDGHLFSLSGASEQVITYCSVCSRTGSVLTFAPAADFELLSGESSPSDYRFEGVGSSTLLLYRRHPRLWRERPAGRHPDRRGDLRCVEDLDFDRDHTTDQR